MPKKQKDGRYRAKVTPAPGEKPVYVSARTLRELNEKKQYVLTHYRDGLKPRDITLGPGGGMVRGHQAPAHPLPQHPAKLPKYH